MSRRVIKQYGGSGHGVLCDATLGIMQDWGSSVPADGSKGYAPGCLFIKTGVAGSLSWYRNDGTKASSDFNQATVGVDLSTLTATAAELNRLDDDLATLATEAEAGITGGTGTVYKTSVMDTGGIITTRILIDLTGLGSSTTDLDIIGQGASAAHIGRITAARNGTILFGRMTCFEVPATGADDIDLYSADEATGKFDDAVTGLTETALITSGGAWTAAGVKVFTAVPAANQYLYLTGGEGGTAGTYTAGQFLIELFGY